MIKIPNCENFVKIEPINKGWVVDNEKKFYIETNDGQRLLLRITDASEYENIKTKFEMLELLAGLNISMSRPINFGFCDDIRVYQLLTWVDGEDIESTLPVMPTSEQYDWGLKAGKILRDIHSVPSPKDTCSWDVHFNNMLQGELESYCSKTESHSEHGEIIIAYLKENNDVLGMRPQTFIHGDYNPGNLIMMSSGELGVIDFSSGYGDPFWDIFKVSWRPHLFPHFYSGQIYGYFNCEPALDFWKVYSYYFAFGALIALQAPYWVGFNNLEEGKGVARNILTWSRSFKNLIPSWYLGNNK